MILKTQLKNLTDRNNTLLNKHASLALRIQELMHAAEYPAFNCHEAAVRQAERETIEAKKEHHATLTIVLKMLELTPLKPERFISDMERNMYENEYAKWLKDYGEHATSTKYEQLLKLK
ncbi:hypothetical protein [Moritella viscosa]|uniref:Ribonuclease n=1 Tax=Moritella viscosa TaxID=80854 RepID=A0A1L0AKY1_9GAMM|nr:hypothetical protein [Moritella viscosa]SGZ16543.1 Ribonuclease [Moritella viscosa]